MKMNFKLNFINKEMAACLQNERNGTFCQQTYYQNKTAAALLPIRRYKLQLKEYKYNLNLCFQKFARGIVEQLLGNIQSHFSQISRIFLTPCIFIAVSIQLYNHSHVRIYFCIGTQIMIMALSSLNLIRLTYFFHKRKMIKDKNKLVR